MKENCLLFWHFCRFYLIRVYHEDCLFIVFIKKMRAIFLGWKMRKKGEIDKNWKGWGKGNDNIEIRVERWKVLG